MEEIQVTLEPQDNNRLSNLCGPLNDNIKILENLLDVKINQRGNLFHFIGKKESVEKASAMIKKLTCPPTSQLRPHLNKRVIPSSSAFIGAKS